MCLLASSTSGDHAEDQDQQDGKIVNGTAAAKGEFPYAVSKGQLARYELRL